MGKRETNETYQDTRNRNQEIGTEQEGYRAGSRDREQIHFDNSQTGRADLHGRFTGLADGGTYDPVNFERLGANAGFVNRPAGGWGGGGGGGGYSAGSVNYKGSQYQDATREGSPQYKGSQYQAVEGPEGITYQPIAAPERVNYNANETGKGAYETLASTGGYDEDRRASIGSQVEGLQEFGRTGGLNDESIGRFRGSGVFDEFARTGGYSDTDQANIRARALSPIGSYATGTQDELNRRRSVQGGFAPGFDAASQSLQRDSSRNIADTSLNAELGIKERVNQGRMGGAQALSQAEGALQGLRTGNMFAGMTGAGNMEMNMQNAINSGQLSGAGGLHNMSLADLQAQSTNAANAQQANMFNADNQMRAGMFNNQQAQALGLANAGNQLQNNQFNAGNTLQNNQFNSQQGQQLNMFNTGNQLQNEQFNVGNQFAADRFNVGARNSAAAQGASSRAAAGRQRAGWARGDAYHNAGMGRENSIYNSQGQYNTDTANRNFDWGTRQVGLSGLQGIQDNDIGQSQAERDREQNSYGLQYGAQGQGLNTQAGLATQPGWGTHALQGIGGLAGMGAAYMTRPSGSG